MLHFSMVHLLLVFAVVLLLFGPKKLPELARGLGEGMKEFRQAVHEVSAHAEEQAPAGGSATPRQGP
jgi:sec-independent protein translocase protein TatA